MLPKESTFSHPLLLAVPPLPTSALPPLGFGADKEELLHRCMCAVADQEVPQRRKRNMGDISRERALLAKEIAEYHIRSMNYTKARRHILRALKIFPNLENATGMLSVCDVICASSIDLPACGVNWYWVMQLSPTADGPTIEAQYQNLICLLDPIKGGFPGTETALQFIQKAYSVLSDPVRRSAFDLKRNGGAEGFGISESRVECLGRTENVVVHAVDEGILMDSAAELPSSSGLERSVHETCDESCKSLDLVQTCPIHKTKNDTCNEASCYATQIECEADMIVGIHLEVSREPCSSSTQLARSNGPLSGYSEFGDNRKIEMFSVGQVWAAFHTEDMPRCYALINKIVSEDSDIKLYITWLRPHPSSLHEKNWCNAGLPVACGSFLLESNKITVSGREISKPVTSEPFEIYPQKGEVWAVYRDWNSEWLSNPTVRKDCEFQVVEILTDYTKDAGVEVAYLTKVDGHGSIFQQYENNGKELSFHIPADKLFMFSHNVHLFRFKVGEGGGVANDMLKVDHLAMPDHLNQDCSFPSTACRETAPSAEVRTDCPSLPPAITTGNSSLDTGIQNHKTNRSPKDFKQEQIWAVYNGPDAMPRLYVKIVDVISENFVSVTFLEPHPMLDADVQLVKEGMPFVCGIFRMGNLISTMAVDKFSHPVKYDQSTNRSFYRILPQKGEVWAMYRNRSLINWKDGDPRKREYRIVEILSDFCEESGVNICSLVEVKGYMTFFRRQLYGNFQLTRHISRQEMLSFSHRIPAFTMVGENNSDIPKESWHLEPDSLPPKPS